MTTKASGVCINSPSSFTNAWIEKSWVNGCLMTLKVASTYHVFALVRNSNCESVENIRWRVPFLCTSPRRNCDATWSSRSSKSKVVGCLGLFLLRWRFAARATLVVYGSEEHGSVDPTFADITSAEMSGHFGTITVVPKCLRSEVSWVRSVLTAPGGGELSLLH